MRADSFASRVVAAARPARPWLHIKASPRVARILEAAGASVTWPAEPDPAVAASHHSRLLSDADLGRPEPPGLKLANMNLTGADLKVLDLTRADLTHAILTGADLTGVDLIAADLTGADLIGANLTRA